MSEWQPIETAPRDGTWVLVCGGDTDETCDNESDRVRPVVAFWDMCWADFDRHCWSYCHWDGDWRSQYENPTHWMPMPSPPGAGPG